MHCVRVKKHIYKIACPRCGQTFMVPFWTCPGVPGLQSRFRACSVLSLGWRLERDGISGWLSFARAMRFIGFVCFCFARSQAFFAAFAIVFFMHFILWMLCRTSGPHSMPMPFGLLRPQNTVSPHGRCLLRPAARECSSTPTTKAGQSRWQPGTPQRVKPPGFDVVWLESEASWIWCGLVGSPGRERMRTSF